MYPYSTEDKGLSRNERTHARRLRRKKSKARKVATEEKPTVEPEIQQEDQEDDLDPKGYGWGV